MHEFDYLFQAIAGYDDGLDPRQPRDIKGRQYSKEVGPVLSDRYKRLSVY